MQVNQLSRLQSLPVDVSKVFWLRLRQSRDIIKHWSPVLLLLVGDLTLSRLLSRYYLSSLKIYTLHYLITVVAGPEDGVFFFLLVFFVVILVFILLLHSTHLLCLGSHVLYMTRFCVWLAPAIGSAFLLVLKALIDLLEYLVFHLACKAKLFRSFADRARWQVQVNLINAKSLLTWFTL